MLLWLDSFRAVSLRLLVRRACVACSLNCSQQAHVASSPETLKLSAWPSRCFSGFEELRHNVQTLRSHTINVSEADAIDTDVSIHRTCRLCFVEGNGPVLCYASGVINETDQMLIVKCSDDDDNVRHSGLLRFLDFLDFGHFGLGILKNTNGRYIFGNRICLYSLVRRCRKHTTQHTCLPSPHLGTK